MKAKYSGTGEYSNENTDIFNLVKNARESGSFRLNELSKKDADFLYVFLLKRPEAFSNEVTLELVEQFCLERQLEDIKIIEILERSGFFSKDAVVSQDVIVQALRFFTGYASEGRYLKTFFRIVSYYEPIKSYKIEDIIKHFKDEFGIDIPDHLGIFLIGHYAGVDGNLFTTGLRRYKYVFEQLKEDEPKKFDPANPLNYESSEKDRKIRVKRWQNSFIKENPEPGLFYNLSQEIESEKSSGYDFKSTLKFIDSLEGFLDSMESFSEEEKKTSIEYIKQVLSKWFLPLMKKGFEPPVYNRFIDIVIKFGDVLELNHLILRYQDYLGTESRDILYKNFSQEISKELDARKKDYFRKVIEPHYQDKMVDSGSSALHNYVASNPRLDAELTKTLKKFHREIFDIENVSAINILEIISKIDASEFKHSKISIFSSLFNENPNLILYWSEIMEESEMISVFDEEFSDNFGSIFITPDLNRFLSFYSTLSSAGKTWFVNGIRKHVYLYEIKILSRLIENNYDEVLKLIPEEELRSLIIHDKKSLGRIFLHSPDLLIRLIGRSEVRDVLVDFLENKNDLGDNYFHEVYFIYLNYFSSEEDLVAKMNGYISRNIKGLPIVKSNNLERIVKNVLNFETFDKYLEYRIFVLRDFSVIIGMEDGDLLDKIIDASKEDSQMFYALIYGAGVSGSKDVLIKRIESLPEESFYNASREDFDKFISFFSMSNLFSLYPVNKVVFQEIFSGDMADVKARLQYFDYSYLKMTEEYILEAGVSEEGVKLQIHAEDILDGVDNFVEKTLDRSKSIFNIENEDDLNVFIEYLKSVYYNIVSLKYFNAGNIGGIFDPEKTQIKKVESLELVSVDELLPDILRAIALSNYTSFIKNINRYHGINSEIDDVRSIDSRLLLYMDQVLSDRFNLGAYDMIGGEGRITLMSRYRTPEYIEKINPYIGELLSERRKACDIKDSVELHKLIKISASTVILKLVENKFTDFFDIDQMGMYRELVYGPEGGGANKEVNTNLIVSYETFNIIDCVHLVGRTEYSTDLLNVLNRLSREEAVSIIQIFAFIESFRHESMIRDEMNYFEDLASQLADLAGDDEFNGDLKNEIMNVALSFLGEKYNTSFTLDNSDLASLVGLFNYLRFNSHSVEQRSRLIDLFNNRSGDNFWKEKFYLDSEFEPDEPIFEILVEEGSLPRNMTLEQYRNWTHSNEASLEGVLNFNMSDIRNSISEGIVMIKNGLDQSLLDLDPILLDEYVKGLNKGLNLIMLRRKEVVKQLKEADLTEEERDVLLLELEKLNQEKKIEIDNTSNIRRQIRVINLLRAVEDISFEEYDEGRLYLMGKKFTFKEIFDELSEFFIGNSDISEAIENMYRTLVYSRDAQIGDSRVSNSKLMITDDLSFEEYFNIGSSPCVTCQRTSEFTEQNFGVMGLITNSTQRIMATRNENGELVARMCVKLAEDISGNPVLLAEPVYTVNPHPIIYKALLNFAKKISDKMNVDLLVSKSDRDDVIINQFLRTPSEFGSVYSDALRFIDDDMSCHLHVPVAVKKVI